MPLYSYRCCLCDAITEQVSRMETRPPVVSCSQCGALADFDFRTTVSDQQLRVFKPYVEENAGPDPVVFETAAQRDAYMAAHHLTYDSTRYCSVRPKRDAWEKDPGLHEQIRKRLAESH